MARRAVTDTTIGERIRGRRQLLGYSLRHAASRAGLAHSTWSRIERGEIGADNRFTLATIAEALRCPVTDLTDEPRRPTDRGSAENDSAVYETIRAVIESDLRYEPSVEVTPFPVLQADLDLVVDLQGRCDYAGAGARLPPLIRGLHAAAFGPDRKEALRSLVFAAETASFVVRYGGNAGSAYLVSERAQQAAEMLDDPVMLGLASWSRSHAATAIGLYERGLTIADQAAAMVRTNMGMPDAAEMYGALILQTAYAAYALGRVEDGEARLAEAEDVAVSTGDSGALRLMFGPTNVQFWRVAMETDGGDPGKAVAIARDTNPTVIPRLARQASFYADTGRALSRIGKDREAVRMIATAERLAPQRIRNSPMVAEAVRSMLERAKRDATGVELRGLCERLGIAS